MRAILPFKQIENVQCSVIAFVPLPTKFFFFFGVIYYNIFSSVNFPYESTQCQGKNREFLQNIIIMPLIFIYYVYVEDDVYRLVLM